MLKIAVVGNGNVGTHLLKALSANNEVDAISVNPHTLRELPQDADAILICVADSVIHHIANRIAFQYSSATNKPMLFHTSGSTSIEALDIPGINYGVVYPMQTFSKNSKLEYSEIPIFIESNNTESEAIARRIAHTISDKVSVLSSKERRKLHLASVFACNFVNHFWAIAEDIVGDMNLPSDTLHPLIYETARKLKNLPAKEAQTGPARRGDEITIMSHLAMLTEHTDLQRIYKQCSEHIMQYYK